MKYKAEIFDIWQNLWKTVYEPLIRCRIDFAGRVDLRVLKRAVDLSIQTIPLMACCFSDSRNRPRWVEKNFTSEDMVRVFEADGADDADEQAARLFSADFDASKEPQLKILLVRRARGDSICAIVSHIVCDGVGVKEYLYLLAGLYAALEAGGPVSIPPFLPRGLQPLFKGVKLGEKMRMLRSKHETHGFANNKEQQGAGFDKNSREPRMETRRVSGEDFEALKSRAKTSGATVNDILMALYARAFCKNAGAEKIMLPSTMDLRKFMPAGESFGIGNCAGICMCHISVRAGDSLADTLSQVSGQMRRHKAGNAILKSVLLWGLAVRFLPYASLKRNFTKIVAMPLINYTNIGIIDRDLLRFGNLPVENAYMASPVKPGPYLQITASTYDGRCTLSCNFFGSGADAKWANALLDDMLAEIAALS
ncbi:MAG: WS/DGAT domain-containing protein [Clostridiales bacterium]|jgi:NRPS condensation-like uncharacterized protein|nr:WS/DGAT domain-containing protein [Clostridiales bacterium]